MDSHSAKRQLQRSPELSRLGDTAQAMSRENVEIVRRLFAAEARRDVATVLALYDPDVEMDFSDSPFADFRPQRSCRGLDEVRSAFKDFYEAFEDVEADLDEVIDAGAHVISVFTYRGRGRASGVAAEWKRMAGVWTFSDGRIVRVSWLRTPEGAFEVLGLRRHQGRTLNLHPDSGP